MSSENFVKVKDAPDLVRDTKSGAIIQRNSAARRESQQQRKQVASIVEHERKIKTLEARVGSLEAMIRNLVEKVDMLS